MCNTYSYNDGCNECQCGLMGDACTERFCQEDMIQKSKCIRCEYGYKLNDFGICYKKQPEPEACCNLIDRPDSLVCLEGSACCPDDSWSCSIGNGRTFSCGDISLVVGEDKFGKICEEQNTLPPGCAALTCVVGSFCCDDGFGGVKCCCMLYLC